MKHLHFFYAILLTSLIPTPSFSQGYHPFPEENAVWTQLVYSSFQSYTSEFYYTYFYNGDTIISGNSYKKVYVGYAQVPEFIPPAYAGALRQDTAQKRVYFVSYDSTQEAVMYDFNLQIGSHIQYMMPPNYESNNLFLIEAPAVYAIDSVYFDGVPHKRFKYHFSINTNPDLYPDALIEGFGNTRGFIYPRPDYPVTGSHDYRDLECLSINGQSVFQTGAICCTSGDSCLTTGIVEAYIDQVSLNCFSQSNQLIFQVQNPNNTDLQLIIYNMLGQEQFRAQANETGNIIIPAASFSSSLYLAVLKGNNHLKEVQKFTVH